MIVNGKIIFARYKPSLSRPADAQLIELRVDATRGLAEENYRRHLLRLMLATSREHRVCITRRVESNSFSAALAQARRSLGELQLARARTERMLNLCISEAQLAALKQRFSHRR